MSEFKGTPIPGFNGYEVTPDGRVYSSGSNWRGYGTRELTQDLNSHGYPSVRLLNKEGKRKRMAVHRLVASAFLPPRPSCDHEIRHLNGDKTDNRATNLAWGTRQDNAMDRDRHGKTSKGYEHSLATKRGIKRSTNPFFKHARDERRQMR